MSATHIFVLIVVGFGIGLTTNNPVTLLLCAVAYACGVAVGMFTR